MEMERVIAWSLVAFAHLLFVWVATRTSIPRPVFGPEMELVFVQLPSLPSPKNAPAFKQTAVPGLPKTARFKVRPNLAIAPEPASEDMPARPLQETTADDRWNTPASASTGDSTLSASNNLMHRFNPIQVGPPGRFRMRKQITPADIVRAISMELFWPPGYTEDPCGGLAKAVKILSTGSTEREHKLLEDAALQQSRYCS